MFDLSKLHHYLYLGRDRISQVLSDVFDPFHIKVYSLSAIFLNLLAWFLAVFIVDKGKGDPMILHYNMDFGVDLVGPPSQLLVVPGLGLVILVANLLLLLFLYNHTSFKFLSHLILAVAVLVNFFLLISLLPVYTINFS